jgi:hypothetical protein
MKKKKTTIKYDLVALSPTLTKNVNENYPEISMGNKSLLKTVDLERVGAVYFFSKNGKISRLFRGKRTYPRLNTSITVEAYNREHEIVKVTVEISNGIGKIVGRPIKAKETEVEQKAMPDMTSVYDIFMVDASKIFKSVRDTAIAGYVYFTTSFGRLNKK